MPDCLDEENPLYREIVQKTSLSKLRQEGYIKLSPKIRIPEHEEVKAYILLEFDDFIPTGNPHYRDCTITFSIICHLDYWELDDYKLRPYQIAGYIDGILNETKLSGIGTLQFLGASELIMNEYLGGIMLRYVATHGRGDDSTTIDPELPAPQDLGGGAW
jgi:hypothetical protein